jgi:hypothetical protein
MRSLLLVLLVPLVTGCPGTGSPTPTGTVCPDPDPNTLTYDNFGAQFMLDYCTMCHAKALPRSQRNGAPIYHDFDTLIGVVQVLVHIDEQSGLGPEADNTFMPPDRCPAEPGGALAISCRRPSDAERRQLAEWLACEKNRPH